MKVALLLDKGQRNYLAEELLQRSKNKKISFRIDTVIFLSPVHRRDAAGAVNFLRRRGFRKFVRKSIFKIIEWLSTRVLNSELKFWHEFESYVESLESFELTFYLNTKGRRVFTEESLQIIRECHDLVGLRCCGGILGDNILESFEEGIYSLHHGDNRWNRGQPPGWWEVFLQTPTTGFVVQKLTKDLDGGEVVCRGSIATDFFYTRNRKKVFDSSISHFLDVIELVKKGVVAAESGLPYFGTYYSFPPLRKQLLLLFRQLLIMSGKLFLKLNKRGYVWNVGFQKLDAWRNASLGKLTWVLNPAGSFLADPCILVVQGKTFIFVEQYIYKEKKGVVSVIEVEDNNNYFIHERILEELFHLSFPFVFTKNGKLYMIPETAQANEVRLYESESALGPWRFKKILIKNVRAVDVCFFNHEGLDWLSFTGGCSNSDVFSQYNLYYSVDIEENEFHPHDANPIRLDGGMERNAGLILCPNEGLFRVSQIKEFDSYGDGIIVRKVGTISKSRYTEELVSVLRPMFNPAFNGVHTFNYRDGFAVIDAFKLGKRV
ncbi:hypothetical protein OAC04_03420 [Gammaproteobacteria bacterium]|nr:hypothetical protein [Gammaproteobacteria bacterium]